MKVHWTDLAVKHLADIHEYIARTSPTYALRIVDRLARRSQQIGSFLKQQWQQNVGLDVSVVNRTWQRP